MFGCYYGKKYLRALGASDAIVESLSEYVKVQEDMGAYYKFAYANTHVFKFSNEVKIYVIHGSNPQLVCEHDSKIKNCSLHYADGTFDSIQDYCKFFDTLNEMSYEELNDTLNVVYPQSGRSPEGTYQEARREKCSGMGGGGGSGEVRRKKTLRRFFSTLGTMSV